MAGQDVTIANTHEIEQIISLHLVVIDEDAAPHDVEEDIGKMMGGCRA